DGVPPERAHPRSDEPKPAVRPPALRRPAPAQRQPSVSIEPYASAGEFVQIVQVSRKDKRLSKMAALQDGLAVKVKDTDPDPLDADIEVYRGNRRIGKFKDLPVDSVLAVAGRSGKRYEIVLMRIYDDSETIVVGLRPGRTLTLPEQLLKVVKISCGDRRLPKRALLLDDLLVKINDTDRRPDDADLEVYLGTRRIGKFYDVPVGRPIIVMGRSNQLYEIVLTKIDDSTETVRVGLRRRILASTR
ncbi:unnamed protein product, partial [marine sediment metagenome]